MESLMTRVQKVLQKEFSPREILLESAGRGKISGWIISKSFDDLPDEERYQKVWRLLDAYLTKKDRDRILGFFIFSALDRKMIFDKDYFDMLKTSSRKKSSSARKKATNSGGRNSRSGRKRR